MESETGEILFEGPHGVEGLGPGLEFPRITSETGFDSGIRVMVRRLGLTQAGVIRLMQDRSPDGDFKYRMRGFSPCRFRRGHYLKFDLIFSDILHTGYDELRHLGVGRRYLSNRIMRSVLAGLCDGFDPTGRAGDFPPRSWLDAERQKEVVAAQKKALEIMDVDQYNLRHSLQVRLGTMSTGCLQAVADRCEAIRRLVRSVAAKDPEQGLRAFSDMLVNYRKEFNRKLNGDILKRKRDYLRKKRGFKAVDFRMSQRHYGQGEYKTWRRLNRLTCQQAHRKLRTAQTEIRRLQDPKLPCWYRRPSDPDWDERRTNRPGTPFTPERKRDLARYGFGGIPGLTEPLSAEDWGKARTDWTVAEARENYRLEQERLKALQPETENP
mgnify:CR=1 FL=1